MNAAHWHLVLNHIPVVATPFAALLLGFALWRKRPSELFGVSLGAFVLIALLSVPAYLTAPGPRRSYSWRCRRSTNISSASTKLAA